MSSPEGVQEVLSSLRTSLDQERFRLARQFVPIFLGKAPLDLLEERTPEELGRMCMDSLRFLEASRPDRVDAEVVNPDEDRTGWYAPVTVVRTNISERPFIVDTIREYLSSQDLRIRHFVYPLMTVERDEDGEVTEIGPAERDRRSESIVYAEVGRVTSAETLDTLRQEIARRLGDVVRATDDFDFMVDKIKDVVAELRFLARDVHERREELREIQAFLRWLRDDGLVFLGYREYTFEEAANEETGESETVVRVEPGSGLGILQDEESSTFARPVPFSRLPEEMRQRALAGPTLIISKTNAESTIHRRARMDYVGVKKLRADGSVAGEHRFLGLFTSKAYSEPARDIPILREKLKTILSRSGVAERSHDYKEIITIFDSLPKEELFLASEEEIETDIRTILTRYNTKGVIVSVRRDALGRGVSIMVVLPRNRFSGEFRRELEERLTTRYDAQILNYHLAMSTGDQARLHFYLGGPDARLDEVTAGELEETVAKLARSWRDEVRERLGEVRPPDDAHRLANRYAAAFAPEYKAATDPSAAVRDILELEEMKAAGTEESARFYDDPGGEGERELKIYVRGRRIVLSDFMPVLENCGLRVVGVSPFELRPNGGEEGSVIYSFAVQASAGEGLDVRGRGRVLSEAVLAVRAGDASNDAFNRLVQRTGMAWREADVLRAYAGYAFQIGAIPSRQVLVSALEAHPEAGLLLFRLFEARFDPELGDGAAAGRTVLAEAGSDDREARVAAARSRIPDALAEVHSLAFDRALRAMWTVVESTVRTNYYRSGGRNPVVRSGGVPYLSLKLDCARLQEVSKNRLAFEVWVHSSRMEGIHLRGAAVARGGVRYSDRPDDFRTEILGLVYTQVVKNAVIVPSGSKGGFVCLRSLPEREAMAAEVKEQYRTLVRGLLDVTDNLNGDAALPSDVVCYDGFDPYLVVAADKGTARFSDLANAVAADYGFWLGDAFASGGSNGYDHKEVGITAGGAWESVKRHFREMGKDVATEPFTVAGIGDMSGDVFGNGMLLSKAIRLVAAFDHRHVFIDPDPDPEASWEERQRLFQLGGSSWDDYDRSKLSKGGMIVSRSLKSVDLTPEAKSALGLGPASGALDGESLIRAVLTAPVELLWNGGIGTYVKGVHETHADAGDPANDAVRINANRLRAKVVAEGGNLGFTQAARVEYALEGGRINTDALDNSGGVNLSDREVNLKILLNEPLRRGEATLEERNQVLRKLKTTVAAQVLRDNESNSRAVSLDEYRARRGVDHFWALMGDLTRSGLLDRVAEGLPSWDDLATRRKAHRSLTRPELAVLLSYAKLHLKSALLASDLPDDPAAAAYFYDYFPAEAVAFAGLERAAGHRLRREIVASQLTNDLVDIMGAPFVARVARETGHEPEEVARAWLVAARLTGHGALVAEIRAREAAVSAGVAYRWTRGLARVLDRTARWVLSSCNPEDSTTELVERNLEGLEALRDKFDEIVSGEDRRVYVTLLAETRKQGVDQEFARRFLTLRFLDGLLEILRIARTTSADPVEAARTYYLVTEELRLPWLMRGIEKAGGQGKWERRWALGIAHDLGAVRRRLTRDALSGTGALTDSLRFADPDGRLDRFHDLLEEMQAEEKTSLASLSAAVQEIRHLGEG